MNINLQDFRTLVTNLPENFDNATLTLSKSLNKQGISLNGLGELEPIQTPPEDNREIRRVLCEALVNSGKCQEETLTRIMTRLGFGGKASQGVMNQQLTCGDVKNILADIDAEPARRANQKARKEFFTQLQDEDFLKFPELKTEIQKRLGLRQGGDASAPLTDDIRNELRAYCLNTIKTHMLGTDLQDVFIGNMRDAGISDDKINKYLLEFSNAETPSDVTKLMLHVNGSLLSLPALCEDAENKLSSLSQSTGKDFSALKEKVSDMILDSMSLRFSSTICEKIETVANLKNIFNQKLQRWCDAKAAMNRVFEAAKPGLSEKAQRMLLDALMDIKFKSVSDFQHVVNFRTTGHSMMNLLQQQNVTEEDILREMKTLQAERLAFGQSAFAVHVQAGEEYGPEDKLKLSDLHTKFARQCWLDDHGLETIPQPWGRTIEAFKKITAVFSTLSDKVILESPHATERIHKQFVMPETANFEKAASMAGPLAEIVKDINDFYIPEESSIYDEEGAIKGMENANEIPEELSPAMLKYLNEQAGFGIRHTMEDGEFTQYTSISLDDIVMQNLQDDVKIGNSSAEMDDNVIWEQYSKDLRRDGYGVDININGQTYHNPTYEKLSLGDENAEKAKICSDLANVFAADTVNGKKAARILARIVHQGFNGLVTENMSKLGEPFNGILNVMSGLNFSCKIDKLPNGSYNFEMTDLFHFGLVIDENTGDMTHFSNDNFIQTKHKYNLAFDENGNGVLTQRGRCEMTGYVKKLTLTNAEQQALWMNLDCHKSNSSSTLREKLFNESAFINSPELKQKLTACMQLQNANTEAERQELATRQKELFDFVSSHVITREHQAMLQAAGIPISAFRLLTGGGTNALHWEHFDALADTTNTQRRNNAISTIQNLLAGLKQNGIIDTLPQMDTRFMALHHKAHLLGRGENFDVTDMGMITKYLRENKADGNRLLEQLNSDDPATANAAVDEVKTKLVELRLQQGPTLLTKQYGIPTDHLQAFQERRNMEDFQELLEHIYVQDDQMDAALKSLRTEIDAAFAENRIH